MYTPECAVSERARASRTAARRITLTDVTLVLTSSRHLDSERSHIQWLIQTREEVEERWSEKRRRQFKPLERERGWKPSVILDSSPLVTFSLPLKSSLFNIRSAARIAAAAAAVRLLRHVRLARNGGPCACCFNSDCSYYLERRRYTVSAARVESGPTGEAAAAPESNFVLLFCVKLPRPPQWLFFFWILSVCASRRAMSSPPMWWTCWGSSLEHDPSRPKRLSAWSASSTASSAPSRCSSNRAPARPSWSCAHAFSMPGRLPTLTFHFIFPFSLEFIHNFLLSLIGINSLASYCSFVFESFLIEERSFIISCNEVSSFVFVCVQTEEEELQQTGDRDPEWVFLLPPQ